MSVHILILWRLIICCIANSLLKKVLWHQGYVEARSSCRPPFGFEENCNLQTMPSLKRYHLPPDLHNLSPRNLAWAPHITRARHRARGRPKMLTPGVPPIVTTSEKPWRVKYWTGANKQKLLLGVGLYSTILFTGGLPKPGARRVHPIKWGCMLWELGGGQQTKVAPRGGFVYKNFICGGLTSTQSSLGL